MFSPSRLTVARHRAGLSRAALARKVGVSSNTISNYEDDDTTPSPEILKQLSLALSFPVSFFEQEEISLFPNFGPRGDTYQSEPASFRAHYNLRVQDKNSVLASSLLGVQLFKLLQKRYTLPEPQIPQLGYQDNLERSPEAAAAAVRKAWGLGDGPIPNMIRLLESKGVRIMALAEDVREVDAFAFWRGDTPFIVLNMARCGERQHFDAAHELGHLVLHREGDFCGKPAEMEANRFAGAFLLPPATFRAVAPKEPELDKLLKLKTTLYTSIAAMIKRGEDLGLYSTWRARQAWIQHAQNGWKLGEPGALPSDTSLVFGKVAALLQRKGDSFDTLAAELSIPTSELRSLVLPYEEPTTPTPSRSGRPTLRVIQGGAT